MPEGSLGRRAVVAAVALGVVAVVAVVAVVWSAPLVPSNDGPQHLLGARAFVDNGPWSAARFVEPHASATGALFTELLVPLLLVLPWKAAYAVALSLVCAAWVASVAFAGASLRRPLLGVVVGATTAFSWCFYMGFLSFELGVAVGLVATGVAVRIAEHPSPRDRAALVVVAALLLFAAHAHLAAAALASVAVVFVLGRRAVAVIAPAALFCAACVVAGPKGLAGAFVWRDLGEMLSTPAWGFVGGPAWRAWPPVVIALLAIGLALRTPGPRRGLAVYALAAILGACVLPRDVPGWEFLGTRPLVFAMPIALVLLDTTLFRRVPRIAVVVVAAIVIVAQLAWSASFHARFSRAAADLIAVLDDAPRPDPGMVLPISFAPADMPPGSDVRYVNPFFNLAQLYVVAHGGFSTFSFAHGVPGQLLDTKPPFDHEPSRSVLVSRRWLYDPADAAAALSDLASQGRRYDSVVVFEDPSEHQTWLDRGYDVVEQRGRFARFHFTGCSLRVVAPERAVVVEDGFDPERATGASHRRSVASDLAGVGCGPIWLRFFDAHGAVVRCQDRERVDVIATKNAPASVDCSVPGP